MTEESNKALVRRLYEEVFERGNMAVVDELVAPDQVNHNSMPGQPQGSASVKFVAGLFRTALPDLKTTIVKLVAEGDKVMIHTIDSGTHNGPLMGIPPSGQRVAVPAVAIFRIEDGKIVERWGAVDMVDAMRQLGLVGGTPPR